MEKKSLKPFQYVPRRRPEVRLIHKLAAALALLCLVRYSHGWASPFPAWTAFQATSIQQTLTHPAKSLSSSPYGTFPDENDPFHFIPCTNSSNLPILNDTQHDSTWAGRYDPNPQHWIWGQPQNHSLDFSGEDDSAAGSYEDRGIYLCGYLDVPLDHTNSSDPRIARLAVTKYQVSGLAAGNKTKSSAFASSSRPAPGSRSNRTIVINPGGPGGSGVEYAFGRGEGISNRLSNGTFDVLGWDPRGVNASLPTIYCFPEDADRDRWSHYSQQYRETVGDPRAYLETMDAMNEALWQSCYEKYGDVGRFMSTAQVARDVDEIRKALGEEELTGMMVSYGTGIGQTYANMFPDHIGRLILDGTEYVRDHRELGGFGSTALDNGTDAWNTGFLGECVKAGPEHCALARPFNGTGNVTLESLRARMNTLLDSLIHRPLPAVSPISGPALITYSDLVGMSYGIMYAPFGWPAFAKTISDIEHGNLTLITAALDTQWYYEPARPSLPGRTHSSDDLTLLVICSDSYDAPQPSGGLDWWDSLWSNMTSKSWIAGNGRFHTVFPCRQFSKYYPDIAEVYRGDLNASLANPVLLVAEPFDPATPLRNGRRLEKEMGKDNARLLVHHGYGHSSRDASTCTDAILKKYIMHGEIPDGDENGEMACWADGKPYDAVFETGEGDGVSLQTLGVQGWNSQGLW